MKLGAQNRTKLVLACVLFITAIILLVRMFAGGSQRAAAANVATPRTLEAPRSVRATRTGRLRRSPAQAAKDDSAPTVSLDPRLRLDLLKQSEETEYKGTGRNIFRAEAEIPKPIVPVITKPILPPQPVVTGPPPPPPINLKFFGFANSPDEPAKVFLSQGDNIFVASEGEIVNRRYKILRITPKSVEIEDVLSNNRQTIPLTQG